jgi:hypothetical protein
MKKKEKLKNTISLNSNNKLKSKLSLNKEIIDQFNGDNGTNIILTGGCFPGLTLVCTVTIATRGDNCDLYTIGHDDGEWCVSKSWKWCRGRA